MTGRLIVCATPIGNLGDVTQRVLEALRAADAVLAEDTRVTRKLFSRFDIHTPLERFDEVAAERKTPAIVQRLRAGAVLALVSDAGTPGVSDPGARLITAVAEAHVPVEALPGASAVLAALVASGLPMQRFYFGGFLARKAGERRRELEALRTLDATLVFFESPHRTAASLEAIAEVLPGRMAVVARELTKVHEEVIRDDVSALAETIRDREALKGEVVLLVGPPGAESSGRGEVGPDAAEVRALVEAFVAAGETRSDAIKRVASDLGLPRNTVYALAHERRTDGGPAVPG